MCWAWLIGSITAGCYFPFCLALTFANLNDTYVSPPPKKRCRPTLTFCIFKPFFLNFFNSAAIGKLFPNNTNCSMCSVNSSVIFWGIFLISVFKKSSVVSWRLNNSTFRIYTCPIPRNKFFLTHTNSKRCCSLYKVFKVPLLILCLYEI